MCGRFSLGVDTDALIHAMGPFTAAVPLEPRFNVAPTQQVAAVVRGPDGLRLGTLRWGLVPSWATDDRGGARMINARSETVDRKPAFRDLFQHRRCWIPADGFYEWRRDPDGGKTPMHIRLPGGRPFVFAGLWDRWDGPEGPVHTCTVLTTEPAASIAEIHDRMPVILPVESRDRWLDPSASQEALKALLRPYPGQLEAYPVSTLVNSPDNDDPDCRTPV